MKASVRIEVALRIPSVPNFVRTTRGDAIDIADLSPKELRAVVKAWAAKVYENAAVRIAKRAGKRGA